MKTLFFLFVALLITTITFSQTSRKGYVYYKASSDNSMRKAELPDAMDMDDNFSKADAKRALEPVTSATTKNLEKGDKVALIGFGNPSISKRAARTGRNPQTGATIVNNGTIEVKRSFKQGFNPTKAQHNWMTSPSRNSKFSKKE